MLLDLPSWLRRKPKRKLITEVRVQTLPFLANRKAGKVGDFSERKSISMTLNPRS